ncbi:MAG: NRDE family protein [Gemmatimonadota bacterium]
MCTLIAFHRVWDDAPLVIAVNRDEAYDRPSSPPAPRGSDPVILMPTDDRAGGTWMGASGRGMWVGLTNRSGGGEDPARRSRGLLCADLLLEPDPETASERAAALDQPYNPFNLVVGDVEALLLVEYVEGAARARRLPPGCHVVTNRPFDETMGEPKARRARALLDEAGLWPERLGGRSPSDALERLASILADHGAIGSDALCLHGGRYGTRSGAVWRIGPGEVELAYADGPPCSTLFERFFLPSTS